MTNASPMSAAVEMVADVVLLLVYLPVAVFFVWRYSKHGQLPSLGIAILPAGWVLVALWDLSVLPPLPYAPIRWFGVVSGLFLLYAALRTERRDPKGPTRP